jgi:hypothetical protein
MTTGDALEQRVRRGTEKRVRVNQYSLLMFAEDFKQGRVLDPEMVAVRPVPGWGYGVSCDGESRVKLWVIGKDLNLKLASTRGVDVESSYDRNNAADNVRLFVVFDGDCMGSQQ